METLQGSLRLTTTALGEPYWHVLWLHDEQITKECAEELLRFPGNTYGS